MSKTLRENMISGVAWMVAMRWVIRGIGFLSTIILARLLAPEDFGLIAMSMIFIAFINILTSFGADMALIQRQKLTTEHYNSAWTLKILQSSFVTVVIFFIAPYASNYFNEPRVSELMQMLCLTVLFSGFENIGVVAFRKNFDFSKEFKYRVVSKLGSFFVTMYLAFTLKTYWALVYGMLFQASFLVILSYWIHPHRPKICFKKIPDIWSFSQWMLLRNIAMYIRKNADSFFIGHFFPAYHLGQFSLSKEIAELPTTEVVWPMARALFPGYASIAHNPAHLAASYLKVLNTISVISFPLGFGLALVSEPLVTILLGDKWLEIIPLIPWLSAYCVVLTLSSSVQSILMATNKMKSLVCLIWLQTIFIVPILYWSALQQDIQFIGFTQFITSLLFMPVFFYSLTKLSLISWHGIIKAIWRPLIASFLMASCLYSLNLFLQINIYASLAIKIVLGGIVYIVSLVILWSMAGKPDGGEKAIIQEASKRLSILNFLNQTNKHSRPIPVSDIHSKKTVDNSSLAHKTNLDINDIFLQIIKNHTITNSRNKKIKHVNLTRFEISNLFAKKGIKVSRNKIRKMLMKNGYKTISKTDTV